VIIASGRQGEQLCWPEPWTRFSARTPFYPYVGPYTRRELNDIAELFTHNVPADYRPTRPSPGLYAFVEEVALNASLREGFAANPRQITESRSGLSDEERTAILGGHMGVLRVAMHRTSDEVARLFAQRVLRDPELARRYQHLLHASRDGGWESKIRQELDALGFDTTPQDVAKVLHDLASKELTIWSGKYEIAVDDHPFGNLTITSKQLMLNGALIHGHEFADGVLSWIAADENDYSGSLGFSVVTGSHEEPLASNSYAGPYFRGAIWLKESERPETDNAFGKIGVYSVAALAVPQVTDPAAFWSGVYNSRILGTDGAWITGPEIAFLGEDGQAELTLDVDGDRIEGWVYSNGTLAWTQPGRSYSGSLTFYRRLDDAQQEYTHFIGRLWQFDEEGTALNSLGERVENG
jgi:hypothetical protein